MICIICDKLLSGKQTKFCSLACKGRSFSNYQCQQARGLSRKIKLVISLGGSCSKCGYSKNLGALTFHHRDPSSKEFELDMRSLSNRSMIPILKEVKKCDLLCSNCHAEEHYPNLELETCFKKELSRSDL